MSPNSLSNIMKKKAAKNKPEKSFEFGQVMTMLEQMNDGIGVIAEAQAETNTKLKETNSRLGSLEGKVDNLEVRFDGLEVRFDGLEGRFDGLEVKVDKLQEDMDIVKSDVSKIKIDLKRKVDYDEFEKLEKRMLKVERLVFTKHT